MVASSSVVILACLDWVSLRVGHACLLFSQETIDGCHFVHCWPFHAFTGHRFFGAVSPLWCADREAVYDVNASLGSTSI